MRARRSAADRFLRKEEARGSNPRESTSSLTSFVQSFPREPPLAASPLTGTPRVHVFAPRATSRAAQYCNERDLSPTSRSPERSEGNGWFWFIIPASPLLHSLRSFSRSLASPRSRLRRSRGPRESMTTCYASDSTGCGGAAYINQPPCPPETPPRLVLGMLACLRFARFME